MMKVNLSRCLYRLQKLKMQLLMIRVGLYILHRVTYITHRNTTIKILIA